MKIIKPPAPLEYTEVTEPVAQALCWFEVKVFLRVLLTLQGAAWVVKFIFPREASCSTCTLETMKIEFYHEGHEVNEGALAF